MIDVDHIVVATADLNSGERVLTELTGYDFVGGGTHDGVGTRNTIMPLGNSFLELVTVDDDDLAAHHPFGRLVRTAIATDRALAAWVIAGALSATADDVTSLRRSGVAVRLSGCDRAIERPDLPFIIDRPAAQPFPGHRQEADDVLQRIEIAGPDESASSEPPGRTRIDRRAGTPALSAIEIIAANGATVRIDNTLWSNR